MDISKLPKWAKEYISKIERERAVAVRALNEYLDNQTPSSIYIDEMESTGEEQGPSTKRRYIQGRRVTVDYEGIVLDVYLRDDFIDLKWMGPHWGMQNIAFIPVSYQQAQLKRKEKMR